MTPVGGTAAPEVGWGTCRTPDHLDTASGLFGDRDYNVNRNGNRTQLVADGETTVTGKSVPEVT